MLPGLLTVALLGTGLSGCGPRSSCRAGDTPAPAVARLETTALLRGRLPFRRRGAPFAWLGPGPEDDSDDEGCRRDEAPAGLVPPVPEPAHPVRAPQRTPALAAHPALTPLFYALCVLLL